MNISVVIPTYNRDKTIKNTLYSVLGQTVMPMEIIVVDDCSTDSTVKIVKSIRKENRLIRLICLKKNQGAQAARNYGIKAAKGDWIAFLDSDDDWLENKLEIQQEAVEKNPNYDVYYGDYYIKKDNRIHYKCCKMRGKDGIFTYDILFGSKVLFQGMLVRKKALEEIGYLDKNVPAYQEWDTNIRLSLKYRYCYINKPLFVYNIHDGETISKDLRRGVRGFQYLVMSHRKVYLENYGIESVLFYCWGMYSGCKRCKDFRQYYYLCMKNFFQLISSSKFLQGKFVKIIKMIWEERWKIINKKIRYGIRGF